MTSKKPSLLLKEEDVKKKVFFFLQSRLWKKPEGVIIFWNMAKGPSTHGEEFVNE